MVFVVSSCENPGNTDSTNTSIKTKLPIIGPHELSETGDTLYYQVPKFSFINQDSAEISHNQYFGKIYVADFFFTTCPTICPVMSSQMVRLQSKLKSAGLQKDINIISHSVNPVHDTPEVLSNYAQSIGADLSNWNFVTGDTTDIYYQGKMGYMIPALPDSTAPGGFLHSDQFILVDKNRHIRGYYDGTSTAEVDQLFNDIQTLLNE
jgi:protein SCO1/2